MTQFPITLERYFFTRLSVISNPDHIGNEGGVIDGQLDSSLDVKQPPDDKGDIYIAEQRVKLDSSESPHLPYSIDIECIGFFKVDASLEAEKRLKAVTIVAHNVLYAAVREAVLTATSRQAWGPFSIGIAVLKSSASIESPSPAVKSVRNSKKRTTKKSEK